jgi:xanthine dehydrogenase/oxidase
MGSFAQDQKPIDIEELNKLVCLNNKQQTCSNIENIRNESEDKRDVHIILDSKIKNEQEGEWYAPRDLSTMLSLLDQYSNVKYRFVSGNTGIGVYKELNENVQVYFDLKHIQELYQIKLNDNNSKNTTSIEFGSQLTLRKMIELFHDCSTNLPGFQYLKVLADHFRKIANVGIRNSATWAGNLMLKHDHLEFPSDVFLCFETINAKINLISKTKFMSLSLLDFLNMDLNGYLIYSITLKSQIDFDSKFKLNENDNVSLLKTFKIMPRSQNAHAYVNAGFRFNIDSFSSMICTTKPSIVFGGIARCFIHADQTESYLIGKKLNDNQVLQRAFQILSNELVCDEDPVLASSDYRKSLAISLFYKFLLYINQDHIDSRLKSALSSIIDEREISIGEYIYSSQDPTIYPVTKRTSKLNAALQTSGEAQYTFDKIPLRNQLEGVFILSNQAACDLDAIDLNDALNVKGVVKILLAKDIPGLNSFVPVPQRQQEKLFADEHIDYAGQALGLVLAESLEQAIEASILVKITYKNIQQRPILSIKDAIEAQSFFPKPVPDFVFGNAEDAITNAPCSIEGDVFLDTQFPFYMENQNAFVEPTDDGFDVYCSTQWLNIVQNAVAQVLNLNDHSNCINVKVKQLGGAYGVCNFIEYFYYFY